MNQVDETSHKQDVTDPNPTDSVKQRIWTSEELFAGKREILISHGSEIYRLRHTRYGRLILQK
jgi:hemin uptake protein HemP